MTKAGRRSIAPSRFAQSLQPSVTQFAQIHHNRPEYASAVNVVTTRLCIVTLPLMTEL